MSTPTIRKHQCLLGTVLLFLTCCLLPLKTHSAPYSVEILGAADNRLYVVQAQPLGASNRAASLQQAINSNMALLPFINVVNPHGIPGGATVAGPSAEHIDFKRFAMAKAHMLITTSWIDAGTVELRCYTVSQGSFMFGNRYTLGGNEGALLDVADKFCADFLEAVIGNGAFFRSNLAFVKSAGDRKKDIWSVRPNGRYLTRLTSLDGEALSPTWSPDGSRVLFSFIDKRSHSLGVYDLRSKTVQRVRFPGNTVIGPSYLPNGTVAVGLTDGRNPSIFLLSSGLQKQGRLEESSAIDVSPSVDASGRYMAFTSSRLGGPQIFLKDLQSGSVRRISQAGSYNTDPSISPDGTVVAYARLEGGGHRIYVQDLVTGQERQVSFGPGSDEEPSFAPDSYFIVFMSTRSGQKELYITTRNGGESKQVPTGPGNAAFPAWGPALR